MECMDMPISVKLYLGECNMECMDVPISVGLI